MQELPAQLIVRSVGYRGVPIPGVDVDGRTGTIPNNEGRVLRDGMPVSGVYVAGWIKRGPTGIIGTNKKCAIASVEALLADMSAENRVRPGSMGSVVERLRDLGASVIDSAGWRSIDAAERHLGATQGRERTTIHERADLIRAGQSS
jgi:ferredoxin--NADP+ reductase